MNEEEMFNKAKNKKARFVTVEIIQNGFLITLPEFGGKDNAKFHRVSIEGVSKFMKRLWEGEAKEYGDDSEKTKTTIEDILPKKKRTKKK